MMSKSANFNPISSVDRTSSQLVQNRDLSTLFEIVSLVSTSRQHIDIKQDDGSSNCSHCGSCGGCGNCKSYSPDEEDRSHKLQSLFQLNSVISTAMQSDLGCEQGGCGGCSGCGHDT
jgi:hypothetical protein